MGLFEEIQKHIEEAMEEAAAPPVAAPIPQAPRPRRQRPQPVAAEAPINVLDFDAAAVNDAASAAAEPAAAATPAKQDSQPDFVAQRNSGRRLHSLLANKAALRRAIVLKELLDLPVGLRHDGR